MFADQVVKAHKEPEEPSLLRKALRVITQLNPTTGGIVAEQKAPTSTIAGKVAPVRNTLSDAPKQSLAEDLVEVVAPKEPIKIGVYGDPTAKKGKRDIRAEAAKQYAFLNNLDFDVVEAPDEKSFPDGKETDRDAADLFTPTPDNKTGRQQFRIYKPDRIREVDVAHALLQRDPEMDKVVQRLSPKMIKTFGGDAKMRYFLARHAVGGYSPEEEAVMALDTAGTPLKELAYLRNYARTGKTVSPVDEMKKARGQL